MINLGNAQIEKTSFLDNSAFRTGGALQFFCDNFGKDFYKCSLRIADTIFSRNSALIEGGAIKWNFYEPQMINVTFKFNQAGEYGDSIASVANQLVKLDTPPIGKKSIKGSLRVLYAQNQTQIQSGGKFSMYFVLADKYGNIVRTDNTSKLFISSNSQNGNTPYPSAIESTTQIQCEGGIFSVVDMVFVAEPNSS
jgi:hypothetical protein